MEQPRLFQSDVDECAEVRDVAHGSAHDRADGEVGELDDILPHQRRGQILARVAPGACNRLQNVGDGRDARVQFFRQCLWAGVGGFLGERRQLCAVTEIALCCAKFGEDAAGKRVGLGVDRRAVERRFPVMDAQESRALGKCRITETRHIVQSTAGFETAMLVAVGDDVLGNRGIDARNTAEECGGGGVEIYADMVDGVLDGCIERFLQFLLADVMLILSDTDRLWVDLNELCQRILHAARDGDCAANRHIVVRQLFLGECGGGVDRCACLVRDEIVYVLPLIRADQCRNELLRLIGCRAVADGNERDVVFCHELLHCLSSCRARTVALCHLNDAARANISCRVNDRHLASCAVAGVEPEYRMPCKRGLQEQLAQIMSKDTDRLFLRLCRQVGAQFAFQCRNEETLVAVLHGGAQLFGEN